MNTPTLIALSPEEISSLGKERDQYKKAYEDSVALSLEKSVAFENMRRQRETLALLLGQACEEMEGIFLTTGELASPEIAVDYMTWARYLEVNFGRKNHVAYHVQEWLDSL